LETASSEQGWTPATVSCLGGDVHFGYVAQVDTPGSEAPIYQLVCSPLRNLHGGKLRVLKLGLSPAGGLIARALARLAGCPPLPASWRITHGPWFEITSATWCSMGAGRGSPSERRYPGTIRPCEPAYLYGWIGVVS
jgi:hypothetical protein